jgi:hypothetical protein
LQADAEARLVPESKGFLPAPLKRWTLERTEGRDHGVNDGVNDETIDLFCPSCNVQVEARAIVLALTLSGHQRAWALSLSKPTWQAIFA